MNLLVTIVDVATIDNGSCEYPESGYDCDGELTSCAFGFTTVSYDGSGNWQTKLMDYI